ncbi:MAG: hypothetical protein HeimC3_37690 [Candidatus Heimdallarchaeota archaeon LC_3]|nr:MAG: hypothetical protein HeimC3_50700 [Candidatus Heimdallarchaeota archaeon LC_3]OLS21020.1 MAG: hypothetical protein HeimC3_37690 [Candidatus Heimdallarchaeota archaeon LC_3]
MLVPAQHKCKTKFDFIIQGKFIVEPHASWKNYLKDEYLTYYYNRKQLADQDREGYFDKDILRWR